jgi:poly(A) polymerase
MKPTIIPRAEHSISRKLIDPDALKVMYRLLNAGHRAYLVGGGVRDLLLGRTPKDFDVGTNAHPHQIKKLFRNCRLVGRRFRLAHIHFGEKIIEVSTFRRRAEFDESENGDRLIRSDNTFGTAEEDAVRRDFTINGLFYDLETFSVLDYVGGIEDLNRRVIRSIGDSNERIPEDPVRIIRAVKFAARLGFDIDPELWQAMIRFAPDIHKCAKARVLEEIYRLMRGGAAGASFQLLEDCGLMKELLPEVHEYLQDESDGKRERNRLFWQYMSTLDELKKEGVELSNALLLGALAVHLTGVAVGQGNDVSLGDLNKRVDELTREWVSRLGAARRDRERLAHMLRSQPRFTRPRGRRFRPRAFVTKHYYPDAEALFALGVRATGKELDTLSRWQAMREEAGGAVEPEPRKSDGRSGRRRRRTRPANAGATRAEASGGEPKSDGKKKSPRSRRRRRRRHRPAASS